MLHALNSSIFLGPISNFPWLSQGSKARLLTYTGRYSLLLFIDMGASLLDLEIIRQRKPTQSKGTWDDTISRSINHPDDGHSCKKNRALKFVEHVSKPYEERPELRLRGKLF